MSWRVSIFTIELRSIWLPQRYQHNNGSWFVRVGVPGTWQGANVTNDSWLCGHSSKHIRGWCFVKESWNHETHRKLRFFTMAKCKKSEAWKQPANSNRLSMCMSFPSISKRELTCWELSHLNIRFVMADILCAHWMSCLAITRRGTAAWGGFVMVNHLV